jgi:hypothetical protein
MLLQTHQKTQDNKVAFSKRKKIKDLDKLSASKKQQAKELEELVESYLNVDEATRPTNQKGSGLYGTSQIKRELKYSASPNEKVIEHDGAYITFGGDKVTGIASTSTGTDAARIDLVVGRMSPATPPDGSFVDNSFQSDAARIYISQLTDIDANFGIDPGKTGYMKARSGIGIKADGVRVIGREGIKLVTGRMQGTNEKNSVDGKLLPAPMIELIAGNNTEVRKVPLSGLSGESETYDPLQGVAMGHNVVKALQDMVEMQQDLIGVMRKVKNSQRLYNLAINIACAVPAAIGGPIAAGAYALFVASDIKTSMQLWQSSIDTSLFEINYLTSFGYRYIESRNVKTT